MNPSAKSAIVFMFASYLQQGLAFLTVPIFTRLLTPSDYGLISVYNSWFAILGTIAMLSLSAGVFNVGMLDFESDRDGYQSSMLILSNTSTLFLLLIYLIFKEQFDRIINLPHNLIMLMFLNYIFSPAIFFWVARQRYEYKYKLSACITVFTSIFSILLSIYFVIHTLQNRAVVKLWSSAVIPILLGVFLYVYLLINGKKFFVKEYWSFALKFNLPLLLHYLAFSILSGSDKVMISSMVGRREAGIYGLVYLISLAGTTAWGAINGSLVPYTFEKMRTCEYMKIDDVVKKLLIGVTIICYFLILLAPEIIKILAPRDYYEGVWIVPPTAAAVFFICLYNVFANIEFYYKKTIVIMAASIGAAFLNLLLNYIFIPRFGYIAAAYTTLISYILLAVAHYFNMCRMQEHVIYEVKYILKLSVTFILLCLSSNFLYINTFFRYIIIFSFLTFLIIFKYKLKKHIGIS